MFIAAFYVPFKFEKQSNYLNDIQKGENLIFRLFLITCIMLFCYIDNALDI